MIKNRGSQQKLGRNGWTNRAFLTRPRPESPCTRVRFSRRLFKLFSFSLRRTPPRLRAVVLARNDRRPRSYVRANADRKRTLAVGARAHTTLLLLSLYMCRHVSVERPVGPAATETAKRPIKRFVQQFTRLRTRTIGCENRIRYPHAVPRAVDRKFSYETTRDDCSSRLLETSWRSRSLGNGELRIFREKERIFLRGERKIKMCSQQCALSITMSKLRVKVIFGLHNSQKGLRLNVDTRNVISEFIFMEPIKTKIFDKTCL